MIYETILAGYSSTCAEGMIIIILLGRHMVSENIYSEVLLFNICII